MSGIELGGFRITLIRDSCYWWDGGAMFGVVPKTLWSRKIPADDLNRVRMGFNCYLIETGDHTILVETGGGDKMEPRFRERAGMDPVPTPLPEVIARAGFDPERIDIVVNSHLHWDHCGGNTRLTPEGAVPNFPRARYYTARGEWEHAHDRHPRDAVSYIDTNYDGLVASGQMQLVEGEFEVAPGVRLHPAPGHNRDLMIVTASSEGRTFCFWSDLIPSAAHVQPTWVAAFDLYPLTAIDTKTAWLARAADENWITGFGHDAEVAFASIARHPRKQFEAVVI
jgi:glyoxylase-like metal-dependent hydrolase (beta-lactamase superfamily II)